MSLAHRTHAYITCASLVSRLQVHMLPESSETLRGAWNGVVPWGELICSLGFLLVRRFCSLYPSPPSPERSGRVTWCTTACTRFTLSSLFFFLSSAQFEPSPFLRVRPLPQGINPSLSRRTPCNDWYRGYHQYYSTTWTLAKYIFFATPGSYQQREADIDWKKKASPRDANP